MFAIIKNNKIVWFSDSKISLEDMKFDKLIEWNFNQSLKYNLVWGSIVVDKNFEIAKINSETREKILSRYSETDQVNLQREAQLIISESFLNWFIPSENEFKILLEAKEAHEYIKSCIEEGKQRILELQ